MSKKSKSGRRDACLDDLPIVKPRKGLRTRKFDPKERLSDPEFVAIAFFKLSPTTIQKLRLMHSMATC